ncbi:MAG: hypothetical protein KBE09_00695 [Candidatus Pacebacteria bacterium]|nr:hypothetical protein [Candidatus Paceibacterota bacterium]
MGDEKSRKIIVSVLIILIILIIGSFFGWYWWLKKQQRAVNVLTEGRGLANGIPAFSGGTLGSTNSNISSSFKELGTTTVTVNARENTRSTSTPAAWRVSTTPAASISISYIGGRPRAFVTERVSGNVFSVDPLTGEAVRVTNTLIPMVYDALWINATDVLLRGMNDRGLVTTFLGHLRNATSSPTGEMVGEYLDVGITAVAAHPDGTSFFSIHPIATGFIGVIRNANNLNERRVWESVTGGWRALWTGNTIKLIQHGSQGVFGSIYSIDPVNRTSRPLLQGVAGLSAAVRADERAIIYSESYIGSFSTFLKTPEGTRTLPIKTLGEKCAWSPSNENIAICAVPDGLGEEALPESWYSGRVHFNDTLWLVHADTGEVRELLNPGTFFGVPVDVTNPNIDPSGLFFTFIDSKNSTPWLLRISEL